MKYSIQIVCAILGALAPVTIEAENDKSAVDQARVHPIPHAITEETGDDGQPRPVLTEQDKPTPFHLVPLEGGDYEVVVTCLEACPAMVWDPLHMEPGIDGGPPMLTPMMVHGIRPACAVVSSYKVTHQPHAAVRDEVEKKRAELAEAALLAEKRAALKEELRAEILAEQAAAGKVVSS